MKLPQIAAIAFACAALGANAQTIYRCGNTYGTQACDGGTTVAAAAASRESDAAASRRETEREMKVATAMEKARLAEEAKGPSVYIPKEKVEAPAPVADKTIVMRTKKAQKPAKAKKPKKAAA